MEVQVTEEIPADLSAKIKVIGVGGGGSNMVNYLMKMGIDPSIELMVANTDAQALAKSSAPLKIQLGNRVTRGLGAGMKPEVGREAALESYDDIVELLQGTDLVFVSAGMGGGTGTGAAPIIAKAAREVGALTVAVVTKPFKFEGRKRTRLAEEGLEALKAEVDSVVVILNDKLSNMVDKTKGMRESFKIVDSVLARAVHGMSCIILQTGEEDINVDFADVRTVMSHRGLALVGMGETNGEISTLEAIRDATESLLFDNATINGAKGMLVNFHMHPTYSFHEIQDAMNQIEESLDPDAEVIFGTYSDENMPKEKLEVTVVVTGLDFEGRAQIVQPAIKPVAAASSAPVLDSVAAPVVAVNSPSKPIATPQKSSREIIHTIRRVSGGDTAELDLPALLRKQAD